MAVNTNDNIQLSLPIFTVERISNSMMDEHRFCNQLHKQSDKPFSSSTVAEYVSAAISTNTRKAYRGDITDFLNWGGKIPCSAEALACYVADRAAYHSVHTITRRVVAISRAHTSQGIDDPAKNDLVRAVIRGVRRKNCTPQRQASPLLKQDIISMLSLMHGTKGIRDRALILIGYAAALRRSELVDLNVEDIQFVREGLILIVRKSKTDQEGKGRKIAVPYGRTLACPVKAVEHWLEVSHITRGALFRAITKSGSVKQWRLTSGVAPIRSDTLRLIGHG